MIRNGTSLSVSQAPDAERNNFVAPSQVDSFSGTLMSNELGEKQGTMESIGTLPDRQQRAFASIVAEV